MLIPIKDKSQILRRSTASLPPDILFGAQKIINDIRARGADAVRDYAAQYDGWHAGDSMSYSRDECQAAMETIPADARKLLEQTAARIRAFAERQRAIYQNFEMPAADGLVMGVRHEPIEAAGCYAPGGRYPLVSSVLMTVIPASVAGVNRITLATPRPSPIMLAAAAIAGADDVLALGGAQAIATLAYGAGITQPCDIIVGPGNQWVAAAKQIIAPERSIDFLAGPSELMIIADDSARPDWIAADLLAQAEHDTAAMPMLLSPSSSLLEAVEEALRPQLVALPKPNQGTARIALKNGARVKVTDVSEAAELVNTLAPEHLQLLVRNAESLSAQCRHYGGLFIGKHTAEIFGDYGIGPNHTLPTSGAARFSAGLSVNNFLLPRTYIKDIGATEKKPDSLLSIIQTTASLARLEGLEAHARAAEARVFSNPEVNVK